MEIFLPIVLLIVFCILFSICGWCCKRHKAGIVYGRAQPVTVTTTHVTATPGNIPPYPCGSQYPMPQPSVSSPAGIGFTHQIPPYPTGAPLAQPVGGYQHFAPYQPIFSAIPYGFSQPGPPVGIIAPYPPVGGVPYPTTQPAPGQLPPPYHEVVGQPGPPQPANVPINREGYVKQSPYNPNY